MLARAYIYYDPKLALKANSFRRSYGTLWRTGSRNFRFSDTIKRRGVRLIVEMDPRKLSNIRQWFRYVRAISGHNYWTIVGISRSQMWGVSACGFTSTTIWRSEDANVAKGAESSGPAGDVPPQLFLRAPRL